MKFSESTDLPGAPWAGFFQAFTDYWWGAFRRIVITRYEVATPKLKLGDTLTIAVVSDIHSDTRFMPASRIREVVDRTNDLDADLIYMGGDLMAQNNALMTPLPLDQTIGELARLHAPLGVFAVLGNHDWWDDPRTQKTRRGPPEALLLLRNAGLQVLQNEAAEVAHASGSIWVAGLDSQQAFAVKRGKHQGAHDLEKTLSNIPQNALSILLAHEPDIFAELPDDDVSGPVDLVLSGHTHGGQIRLFGLRPVVPSKYGSRYAYGQTVGERRHLIVSGGLGCSAMPLRLGVLPEIVHVTVRGTRQVSDM